MYYLTSDALGVVDTVILLLHNGLLRCYEGYFSLEPMDLFRPNQIRHLALEMKKQSNNIDVHQYAENKTSKNERASYINQLGIHSDDKEYNFMHTENLVRIHAAKNTKRRAGNLVQPGIYPHNNVIPQNILSKGIHPVRMDNLYTEDGAI